MRRHVIILVLLALVLGILAMFGASTLAQGANGVLEGTILTKGTEARPIVGAVVELSPYKYSNVTDGNGTFSIEAPFALYDMKVTHPDFETYILYNVLIIDGKVKDVTVYMDPGTGRISGHVTDARTGKAIDYAYVYYSSILPGVYTDADGHYTISSLDEGSYVITVSKTGEYDPVTISVEVAGISIAKADFTLDERPVFLAGQIKIDGKYSGIEGARIKVLDKKVKTTKNGRFRIEGLYSGTFKVKVEKGGYEPVTQMVNMEDGSRTMVLYMKEEETLLNNSIVPTIAILGISLLTVFVLLYLFFKTFSGQPKRTSWYYNKKYPYRPAQGQNQYTTQQQYQYYSQYYQQQASNTPQYQYQSAHHPYSPQAKQRYEWEDDPPKDQGQ